MLIDYDMLCCTTIDNTHVSCYAVLNVQIHTPNLPTNIVDFRGVDSSTILILRGGILMSIGDFPESLSQAMLVGTMLVGRLGVGICTLSTA